MTVIIKQIFTEPETEVKWYFDSIEEIVIVYIRNRLRGTFACACNTLRLRLRLAVHWATAQYLRQLFRNARFAVASVTSGLTCHVL